MPRAIVNVIDNRPAATRSTDPFVALVLACALTACHGSHRSAPPPVGPGAHNVAARANDTNALAAYVTFDSVDLASASVVAVGGGEETRTPIVTVTDGPQEILVLGLLPATDYSIRVEATGNGASYTTAPLAYRTPALPPFLAQEVRVQVTGTASAGYTITSFISPFDVRHYAVAFDGAGRVRWYRHMPGIGAYAGQLPNGNYALFVGLSTGYQADRGWFSEVTPGGREIGRLQLSQPWFTDCHELLLTPAAGGGWMTHLFGYDIRVTDTTRVGGQPGTNLAGHQIVRLTPGGAVDFVWDAWDHFQLEDWIEEPTTDRQQSDMDFDHPNSLDFDADGNYVASWRHLAEVTKIDARDGRILWRFGGRNNEFTVLGDPLYNQTGGFAFCGQHSVRLLSNGNLLLFDNGLRHFPRQSRAVEYRLDVPNRTATMVWEYRHDPPVYTPFTGSVERLRNGNTLVGFAFRGQAVEVDPAGAVVWEADVTIDGFNSINYRMSHIESLYGTDG